jgi:hypothetical protein
VATLGTAGTLMGVSRRLKEYDASIQIIGVEPYLGHKLQGLKNMKEAYCPEIFEKDRLDQKLNVDDEAAYEMARRLAKEEGIFVGMSSGAAMVGATVDLDDYEKQNPRDFTLFKRSKLSELKRGILILKKQLHPEDASKLVEGFRSIDTVLNQFDFFDDYDDPKVQRLLRQRDKARSEKNWDLSDKIRDELRLRGILVQDQN